MGFEALGLVAVSVLALDIWAAISVIGARRPWTVKLAWISAIVLLPLVGFLVWLVAGPRSAWTDH